MAGSSLLMALASNGLAGYAPPTKSTFYNDTESLYLPHATLGSYNRQKFCLLGYARFTNAGPGNQTIVAKSDGSNGAGEEFVFKSGGARSLKFEIYANGGLAGELVTLENTSLVTSGQYFHYKLDFDSTQAAAADRMKMFIDGAPVTSFLSRTNPAINTTLHTSPAADLRLGSRTAGAQFLTGNIFQPAMYSGIIPNMASVYDGIELLTLPARAQFVHNPSASITRDDVLKSGAWVNMNGTTTVSDTIPVF